MLLLALTPGASTAPHPKMLAAATSGRLVEYTDAKGRLGRLPARHRPEAQRSLSCATAKTKQAWFRAQFPARRARNHRRHKVGRRGAPERGRRGAQNSAADDLELLHETLEGAAVPLEEAAARFLGRVVAALLRRGGCSTRRAAERSSSVRSQTPTGRAARRAEAAALLKQLDAQRRRGGARGAAAKNDACAADGAAPLDLEAEEAETRRGFEALDGSAAAATTSAATGAATTTTPPTRRRSRRRRSSSRRSGGRRRASAALLVQVGVWDKHEDLQLIGTACPSRFRRGRGGGGGARRPPPPDADARVAST